jgi:hypothetical protein
MTNKPTLREQIEEILRPHFVYEWEVCKDCGHGADKHYWNGGGRPEASGYDQCRVDGCKCVSQNFEARTTCDGMPTDQILKLIQERLPKEIKLVMDEHCGFCNKTKWECVCGKRDVWNFCIAEMKKEMK